MSTDILTQLQTQYDLLLQQFFSATSYLSQCHPLLAPRSVKNDPYTDPSQAPTEPGPEDTDPTRNPFPLQPVDRHTFREAQDELAEDLVSKCQQIQDLIRRLPGLEQGESEQAEDIRRLVEYAEDIERVRSQRREEVGHLVQRLEAIVGGMSTGVGGTKGAGRDADSIT